MVKSLLHESINYHETKSLDHDDNDLNATIYEVEYFEIPLQITVGNQKYMFIEKNVIYVPIYLIFNGTFVEKIGVYEFLGSDLMNILDEDEDIDINQLGEPLLFSYVNRPYLEKFNMNYSASEVNVEEESHIEDDDDESIEREEDKDTEDSSEEESNEVEPEFSLEELIKDLYEEDENMEREVVETEMMANDEERAFVSGTNWLQTFMKNGQYTIEDNEGGGDCLFAVVRDAFATIGKSVTVEQLREILANEATQTQLDTLLSIYNSFNDERTSVKQRMQELRRANEQLKKKVTAKPEPGKTGLTHQQKREMVELSKQNVKEFKQLKESLALNDELIKEYRYLDGVKTLDDFKRVIQTCEYWGETWALSTLERVLNIKIIVLSSEHYENGDHANVLQCGHLNDTVLEERGSFTPKYYIMTDWLGWHYKSVLYKGKTMLTYEELPYGIKKMVFDRCLERLSGPYALIPKFMRDKKRYHESNSSDESEEESNETPSDEEPAQMKGYHSDPSTVFQYYESSAHKKPGVGSGETITHSNMSKYAPLHQIKHWRRLLSNKYSTPFTLDERSWDSVEHYVIAQHYKATSPEFYNEFSLQSKSDLGKRLSKDVELALKTLTMRTYKSEEIRPDYVVIDSSITREHLNTERERAMHAKFTQNENAKQALLLTNDATLMKYIVRKPAQEDVLLMRLRNELLPPSI